MRLSSTSKIIPLVADLVFFPSPFIPPKALLPVHVPSLDIEYLVSFRHCRRLSAFVPSALFLAVTAFRPQKELAPNFSSRFFETRRTLFILLFQVAHH